MEFSLLRELSFKFKNIKTKTNSQIKNGHNMFLQPFFNDPFFKEFEARIPVSIIFYLSNEEEDIVSFKGYHCESDKPLLWSQ